MIEDINLYFYKYYKFEDDENKDLSTIQKEELLAFTKNYPDFKNKIGFFFGLSNRFYLYVYHYSEWLVYEYFQKLNSFSRIENCIFENYHSLDTSLFDPMKLILEKINKICPNIEEIDYY